MNVDTLDQLSDEALNEVFAVEVCGWELGNGKWEDAGADGRGYCRTGVTLAWEGPWVWDGKSKFHRQGLNFSTSADAVLPWLAKSSPWRADGGGDYGVLVQVWSGSSEDGCCYRTANAPTFARAACLALVRAARAKKKAGMEA